MNKFKFFSTFALFFAIMSAFLFPTFAKDPLTFSQMNMDKDATTKKYQNDWNDTTIKTSTMNPYDINFGDQVATITIPKMNIYEYPIYYGSNPVLNDWHITTAGHDGNYSMFGETGVSCVGAHNYQLFKELPILQKGDKILIETSIDRYVYVVQDTAIYNHKIDNWNEVATYHTKDNALNLMTCYPINAVKTDDMYIVYTILQKGTIFN